MDEWAVGVILFYMFSGAQYPTFKDKKVKFTEPVWKNYVHAKPVKQLIRALLNLDDGKRIPASRAL